MRHPLLNDSQEYVEETYEEVKTRYVLFGKDIYDILKENEPAIFDNLKFYKATKLIEKTSWGNAETENSYAIYDDGNKIFRDSIGTFNTSHLSSQPKDSNRNWRLEWK